MLFFAIALLMASATLGNGWELLLESDNLRIQRRPYAGSTLHEIRGEIRLQVSLNALMALLRDADFNRHWVYRSGGAKILQENGFAQAYVYGIVDAPWPMQNRDTVVRFDYQQDPRTRIVNIAISNFPNFIPAQEGLVRVPDFGGFWQLRPLNDGWVEVIYQVYGDPGGWVPMWMANYAAVKSVTRTLQNMRPAAERYSGARSEFVKEAVTD